MTTSPLISICIPAYKNVDYLKRLLDSISIQRFRDYEVIITDDSPDDSVSDFVTSFEGIIVLTYVRNPVALGTPENWNAAIKLARGEWIKLMHDDDWFQSPESLNIFVDEISRSPSIHFIYSAYSNVNLTNDARSDIRASLFRRRLLHRSAVSLVSKNIIGPPSAVLYKRSDIFFDRRLKWLVDIDFYIRFLQDERAGYIDKTVVNIGISELQVTKTASRIKDVEVPEFCMLFEKIGFSTLRNIWVYDAWWRLIRNFSIRDARDIQSAGYKGDVSPVVRRIIVFQNRLPKGLLRFGVISKVLMVVCYVLYSPPRIKKSKRARLNRV
jgi:glycosyltransferase involved in cell wall biosynthesis